jgi:hypothetical protein
VLLHFDGHGWTDRSDGLPEIRSLGGNAGHLYAAGDRALFAWDGTRWAVEIDASSFGDRYRGLRAVCATSRHVVVVDESRAFVRAF